MTKRHALDAISAIEEITAVVNEIAAERQVDRDNVHDVLAQLRAHLVATRDVFAWLRFHRRVVVLTHDGVTVVDVDKRSVVSGPRRAIRGVTTQHTRAHFSVVPTLTLHLVGQLFDDERSVTTLTCDVDGWDDPMLNRFMAGLATLREL